MSTSKRIVSTVIANIIMCLTALFVLILFWPVGLLFVAAVVIYNVCERKSHREQQEQYDAAVKEMARLQAELQPIVDAQEEASKITADAQQHATSITQEADSEASEMRSVARQLLKEAKIKVEEATDKAEHIISTAKTNAQETIHKAEVDAAQIVTTAETKAEEIIGDAKKLSEKVDTLRQTEVALKNIVSGYGDVWLKPSYSFLDELAEDFGHTDAGAKLKEARACSVKMVKNGMAATCDYVEAHRSTTAINFVVDAFNGKVDSILSKTKRDNYGKLEQQIRDAYALVNHNGQAFRNARIKSEYLDARLEELKWAVIVNDLKAKEMEEQRRIREQMREEAKAQREYERAQKQSEKEEALLKQAMEKAQAMLLQATEEQKTKYEEQLQALQQKLAEAEIRKQKALSMAQQTRHGNVYVISNIGSFGENVYKVGMTRRLEPLDRVRELGDASVPFAFDVHAIIENEDAPALEHKLHQELALMQMNKVNPRKEFFRVKLEDIKALVDKLDLSAKWTMTAEAAEYRETLAIEERMKNDPEAQARWQEFYSRIANE